MISRVKWYDNKQLVFYGRFIETRAAGGKKQVIDLILETYADLKPATQFQEELQWRKFEVTHISLLKDMLSIQLIK